MEDTRCVCSSHRSPLPPVLLLGHPSILQSQKEEDHSVPSSLPTVLWWGVKTTHSLRSQSAHCVLLPMATDSLALGALGTVSHTHRSGFLAVIAPPVSQGEVLSGLACLGSTNTHDMRKRLKGTDQLLAASPTTSQAAERPLRALTKAGPCGQPACVLGSQVTHRGAFVSPGRGPVTECLSSGSQ